MEHALLIEEIADAFAEITSSDGDTDQAALRDLISKAQQAIHRSPGASDLFCLLGDMISLLEDSLVPNTPNSSLRKECYLRAIVSDPLCVDAWTELGFCYDTYDQDFLSAQYAFQRALAVCDFEGAYLGLARTEAQLGNREVAVAVATEGLSIFAESESLTQVKEEIRLGEWDPIS